MTTNESEFYFAALWISPNEFCPGLQLNRLRRHWETGIHSAVSSARRRGEWNELIETQAEEPSASPSLERSYEAQGEGVVEIISEKEP